MSSFTRTPAFQQAQARRSAPTAETARAAFQDRELPASTLDDRLQQQARQSQFGRQETEKTTALGAFGSTPRRRNNLRTALGT